MSRLPTSDLLVHCVTRWLAFRYYFGVADRLDGHGVSWKIITDVTGIRKKEYREGDLLAWMHGAHKRAWEDGPSSKRKSPAPAIHKAATT